MKLELTLEEVNAIVSALAVQPYSQVANLIAKVAGQAKAQAEAEAVEATNVEEEKAPPKRGARKAAQAK